MGVLLPSWWSYPEQCDLGHEWGPGRVIVGWRTCAECPNGRANHNGHRWVRCRAEGCTSFWYDPPHNPRRLVRREGATTTPRLDVKLDPEKQQLREWGWRTRAEVRAKMLAHPPRKIRDWVRKTYACYEPGQGWYVIRPAFRQRPQIDDVAEWLQRCQWSDPYPFVQVRVEPPVDWPVSSDVRAWLAAQRMVELLEDWETVPNPTRDPTEDIVMATLVAALAAIGHALGRRHS
jgi:hypothetical protein